MSGPTTSLVYLTDDELTLLDGHCRDDVQVKVAAAQNRIAMRATLPDLTPAQAGLVADVVTAAHEHGWLRLLYCSIDRCGVCGRSPGYVPFKSGPRRGQPNHKKLRVLSAIDFDPRLVRIRLHAGLGGCVECVKPLVPVIAERLRGVLAELPEQLRAEGEPKRKRHANRRCTACGWMGHEGEMRKARTVFDDGYYPAGCPSCEAENRPFGRSVVEMAEGFTVVTPDPTPAGEAE